MATAAVTKKFANNSVNLRSRYTVREERMDFDEVLTLFVRSRRSGTVTAARPARERTIYEYEYDLNKFFGWMQSKGVKRYSEIRRTHVADFIEHYQSLDLKPSSKGKMFRSVRALFNFTRKDEDCRRVGLTDFTSLLPRIPKNEKNLYIPSVNTMMEFLNALDQTVMWGLRDYVVTCLILDCGVRIGEVCELTPEHIKWDSAHILVPEEGKTGTRIVPIDRETTIPLLKRWVHVREKFAKVPQLFVSKYGGKCSPNTFDQSFDEIRQATNIGKEKDGNLTPHTVRHFFCTYYLVNGGSLQTLQQITGHESLETLMIYVHYANQLSVVKAEHAKVSPLKNLPRSDKKRRKMF
jgi:site-specific recombinase XerD